MSAPAHNFSSTAALQIPDDIKAGEGWPPQMVEMSDHIGAKATLQLVERFGGQDLYIPKDPHSGKIAGSIRDAIGAKATETLCKVYGSEKLAVPVARTVLDRARRHDLIAAVRAGDISVSAAARILGSKRNYVSFLVNHTSEGMEIEPTARAVVHRTPGQLDMFGASETDD